MNLTPRHELGALAQGARVASPANGGRDFGPGSNLPAAGSGGNRRTAHNFLLLALALACLIRGCEECPAAEIPEALAVRALIGEAGNQPYNTQVLVARAIRNRGGLNGVYGVNNPCVDRACAAVRARALRAWRASATLHFSARYFGCEADKNYFLRNGFAVVCQSAGITFYRHD